MENRTNGFQNFHRAWPSVHSKASIDTDTENLLEFLHDIRDFVWMPLLALYEKTGRPGLRDATDGFVADKLRSDLSVTILSVAKDWIQPI